MCTRHCILLMLVANWIPAGLGGSDDTERSKLQIGQHSDVYYALNAGGAPHLGQYGILYGGDVEPSVQASGGVTAHVPIDIAESEVGDQVLYQSERYGFETFSYEIPTPPDGKYTLILRFAEVAFSEVGKKVFNVVLNDKHVVVRDLDIFRKVGFATAYDEYVPFLVKDRSSTLKFKKKSSKLGDTFKIEFLKGSHDNPKICAFVIVEGSLVDAQKIIIPPNVKSGVTVKNEQDMKIGETGGASQKEAPPPSYQQRKVRPKRLSDSGDDDEPLLPLWSIIFASSVVVAITIIEWIA